MLVMTRLRLMVVFVVVLAFAAALALFAFSSTAEATHSWGSYHWARTANPFTLKLGDNVTSTWDSYMRTTSTDWTESSVLDTTIVAGGTNPKNCRPTSGRVEVCNASYGNNGWLGVAQIWASGSHITQGAVKLNDYYFNTAKYNTTAWRNSVMCQEVGHTLGLGHNDEDFNTNSGTCMDYSNNPGPNQQPNQHDYDQLAAIYAHLDSTTTVSSTTSASTASKGPFGDPNDPRNESGDGPPAWGKEVFRSADGMMSIYEKDFGNGEKKITHVKWTEERAAKRGHHE